MFYLCERKGNFSQYGNTTYSGKLSREKTFANFAILCLFAKVFSVKYGGMASLARYKRAIHNSFLREIWVHGVLGMVQASNPQKFSP